MSRSHTYPEFIHPYDRRSANLFVRAEHLARYLYATQFLRRRRLRRALDVGCGDGYGCRVLAGHAEWVVGVDHNRELLERGARLNEEGALKNVALHETDLAEGLSMAADGSFDLITCFEVLEHVPDDGALLDELHRALRRGGWLLLSVPKDGYEPVDEWGRPVNPYHLRLYREEGLRTLLRERGFAVERLLGQPYANVSRRNQENWRRDTGQTTVQTDNYFAHTPEALEFYAHMWGWPTDEAPERSNVLLAVCCRI